MIRLFRRMRRLAILWSVICWTTSVTSGSSPYAWNTGRPKDVNASQSNPPRSSINPKLPTIFARGSLPGTGEETQEIDNLLTKEHEVVHTYGWYLRKMIADTKAKGAIPIVLSLTVRNIWKDGRVERGSGKFGLWAYEVAASQNVQFVDITKLIADKYEELGEEKVKEQMDRYLSHRLHR